MSGQASIRVSRVFRSDDKDRRIRCQGHTGRNIGRAESEVVIVWTKRALIAVSTFWAGWWTAVVWLMNDGFRSGLSRFTTPDVARLALILARLATIVVGCLVLLSMSFLRSPRDLLHNTALTVLEGYLGLWVGTVVLWVSVRRP